MFGLPIKDALHDPLTLTSAISCVKAVFITYRVGHYKAFVMGCGATGRHRREPRRAEHAVFGLSKEETGEECWSGYARC